MHMNIGTICGTNYNLQFLSQSVCLGWLISEMTGPILNGLYWKVADVLKSI